MSTCQDGEDGPHKIQDGYLCYSMSRGTGMTHIQSTLLPAAPSNTGMSESYTDVSVISSMNVEWETIYLVVHEVTIWL